jgi:hypothetical protein
MSDMPKNSDFNKSKRYVVQAKRKDTYERWSAWIETDDFVVALKQCKIIEELGHWWKIIDRKEGVITINAKEGE